MTKRILIILLIAALSATALVSAQEEPGTILEEAAKVEGLSTMAGAIGLADPAALEALSGEGPFTLFAPNDDAFAAFGTENAEMMSAALSDVALLTNILMYHIVPDEVTAESLLAAIEEGDGEAELPTLLEGATLLATLDDDGNVLINGAMIVQADIMASNGVVHVIGSVLIPPMEEPLPPSYVMEIPAGEKGSEDNPLVLMFIPSEDAQEVLAGAEDLAAALTEKTGLYFEPTVSTDFSAAVEAVCSDEADIVALNTFNYVRASAAECAEVGVVSIRFGSAFYQGQIITLADSGIESYADLKGTTFCRPDATSTSGWVIPSIAMAANGIDIENDLEIIDVGGHDAVVQAVYNGDCDAGATFVDARTNVAEELTDVMDKVLVIELSAPIPNDTLSFNVNLSDDIKQNLVSALVELSLDEESKALLSAVYSWDALEPAEDAFFDDFREQLDAAGIDIETFGQ